VRFRPLLDLRGLYDRIQMNPPLLRLLHRQVSGGFERRRRNAIHAIYCAEHEGRVYVNVNVVGLSTRPRRGFRTV